MYSAYPARVLDPGDRDGVAVVTVRGRRREVAVLGLDVAIHAGDWLLVAAGVALARIDSVEAEARWRELDQYPEATA